MQPLVHNHRCNAQRSRKFRLAAFGLASNSDGRFVTHANTLAQLNTICVAMLNASAYSIAS